MSELVTLLQDLIGKSLQYEGASYRVIEVLPEAPALVLQSVINNTIQGNQFGDAQRRTPTTLTLPATVGPDKELHSGIRSLLSTAELQQLRTLLKQNP